MPTEVDRHQVQELLAQGGQLVDVMPESEFEASHLAGALNLPLKQVAGRADQLVDRNRPVIVYCYDSL